MSSQNPTDGNLIDKPTDEIETAEKKTEKVEKSKTAYLQGVAHKIVALYDLSRLLPYDRPGEHRPRGSIYPPEQMFCGVH